MKRPPKGAVTNVSKGLLAQSLPKARPPGWARRSSLVRLSAKQDG
jgi:hypothetical protein